jgi:hypothetical protein
MFIIISKLLFNKETKKMSIDIEIELNEGSINSDERLAPDEVAAPQNGFYELIDLALDEIKNGSTSTETVSEDPTEVSINKKSVVVIENVNNYKKSDDRDVVNEALNLVKPMLLEIDKLKEISVNKMITYVNIEVSKLKKYWQVSAGYQKSVNESAIFMLLTVGIKRLSTTC